MAWSRHNPKQYYYALPAILPWFIRFTLVSTTLLYLLFNRAVTATLDWVALSICLVLVGLAAAFMVRAVVRPKPGGTAPMTGVGFDSLAISSGMYFGAESASALYVLYVLSSFTSGYRHGINTMLMSAGLNALGFTFVITQNEYWHNNIMLALGLLVTLVVLPLYSSWLVDKLVKTSLSPSLSGVRSGWDRPETRLIAPLRGIVHVANQLFVSPLNNEQRSRVHTVRAAATSLISILRIRSAQQPERQPEQVEFDLHQLLRDTVSLMSGPTSNAGGKRVDYEIAAPVPFRLNGDAFALQQVLIELTNELLHSAFVHCVDITVGLTESRTDDAQVWLLFEIAAGYDLGNTHASETSRVHSKGPVNDTQPLDGAARFVTDIAPGLVESLGGHLLPNMNGDGHTVYKVHLPFAQARADARSTESRNLRQTRAMVIGGDLSGRVQTFRLLLGWGLEVAQRDSIALAFADLIQGANRALGYHLIVVDSRGLDADINAIACAVKQEPLLRTIPMILIAPQRISAQWKANALRAGYATILETPLNKTLLFNALHATDYAQTQPQDGVVHLINHYAATNRVAAPLEILITVKSFAEQTKIKAMLEQLGHRVYTARNGAQALEALDKHHFDLAFFDLSMPQVDGLEALRLYRHSRTESNPYLTPVIMLTEDRSEGVRDRCIDGGAQDVLVKPVRKYELLTATDQAGSSTRGESRACQRFPEQRTADKHYPSAVILDQETLNDLELLGSGIAFVAELVTNFLQDGQYLLERMATAQQHAQMHIFRDIAYALKGSAGSVGAKALFKLASEACTLRGKRFEQSSAELIADLNRTFQASRTALLAHIEERRRRSSQ